MRCPACQSLQEGAEHCLECGHTLRQSITLFEGPFWALLTAALFFMAGWTVTGVSSQTGGEPVITFLVAFFIFTVTRQTRYGCAFALFCLSLSVGGCMSGPG